MRAVHGPWQLATLIRRAPRFLQMNHLGHVETANTGVCTSIQAGVHASAAHAGWGSRLDALRVAVGCQRLDSPVKDDEVCLHLVIHHTLNHVDAQIELPCDVSCAPGGRRQGLGASAYSATRYVIAGGVLYTGRVGMCGAGGRPAKAAAVECSWVTAAVAR